ncbi:LRRN4 C-terminal-like protein [Pagrus major]|uniref:LRRN4 C-terminal-like protein n=1 Tax=Pagrus major TaxID=143350 RepID=UPI003CC868C9
MTSHRRNLVVLLIFLTASPLLTSHLFARATTASPPFSRHKVITMGDIDDPPIVMATARTTLQQHSKPCPYNPCSEDQKPCPILAAETGCLCPGISRDDAAPHAPRIDALLPVTEGEHKGKVEIRWCAPSSPVSGYTVVIDGKEKEKFQASSRKGWVRSLEAGTKVCVEALNKAGPSSPTVFSCTRYNPQTSDHKLLAGIIGGGVSLLIILIIGAVILWKYKLCQKAKGDSADGLGNPSYSTEGTL